jgi:chromosome segregation protein
MTLSLEAEKFRLQIEQRYEELTRLGFEEPVPLEGVNMTQVERTLQAILQEKRSLGMINQLAIQAYEEDAYNYKMLSVRINELEEEKGSILRFIDEIEKEKTEHFMRAYNDICENFSNIFIKLTGGGDGRLELQKPESPFSGGVDLYIQFPGKPMRLAGGASGGERSVAAIAYLLAIQRFLKSPFYLFDEIDAHLDDLNTARLADVLKENSLEAQFLMVSLKDVMVHNADKIYDKIYGVFAQQGRSKVITLPMKMEVQL